MKKLFVTILFLFLIVALLGLWFWIRNPFSQEAIKLEITAVREADLFEEVKYQVRYRNNGNIRIDDATLIFQFPRLTIVGEDLSLRNEIEIGSIYPGEERTLEFSGRLVGKENEAKKAEVSLAYRPKNISALYESSTSFSTNIKSVPISFEIEIPSQLSVERVFNFSVDYFSRLEYPLSDLKIQINYPSNFVFLESNPRGVENNEWVIPLLNRTEGGRVEIRGEFKEEAEGNKFFEASLGLWREGEFVVLKEITKGTKISDPDLYIFQRVNNRDEYTANPGEMLHYEIFFRNIGKDPFSRLSLISRLQGGFFDADSIMVMDGRQSNSDLMWDWREISKLEYLDKGEEGLVEFWVEVKDAEDIRGESVLTNSVSVSRMTEIFSVKVNTKVDFEQMVFYNDEVFGNRGPFPLQAGETTTFTVNWQTKNFHNDLRDVAVKAILPNNVELTGSFFPEGREDEITFDSDSREIVWRVGNLKADKRPVSVSFQVALTPSINQIGQVLPIVNQAKITGIDTWTKEEIEVTAPKVETNLPHDPLLRGQEGAVQ